MNTCLSFTTKWVRLVMIGEVMIGEIMIGRSDDRRSCHGVEVSEGCGELIAARFTPIPSPYMVWNFQKAATRVPAL